MGRYFEGWYFKHRMDGEVFAAIPGMVRRGSHKTAFIQTISGSGSAYHEFPYSALRLVREPLQIHIAGNRFSRDGMLLRLPNLDAHLEYGPMTPLTGGDIMGPFRHVPLMECYHGVLSLRHDVRGYVRDGARAWSGQGSGYIEKDWGRSFPRWWVWMECHQFQDRPGDSVMLAVARVPFMGFWFTGILCVCQVDGAQHRIASYLGARLLTQSDENGVYQARIAQRGYQLDVRALHGAGKPLLAPMMGQMTRTIQEYPCCQVCVQLRCDGKALLCADGECAGFERVTE